MFGLFKKKKKHTTTLGMIEKHRIPRLIMKHYVATPQLIKDSTLAPLEPFVKEFTETHESVHDVPFWACDGVKKDLWLFEDLEAYMESHRELLDICFRIIGVNTNLMIDAGLDSSTMTSEERTAYVRS